MSFVRDTLRFAKRAAKTALGRDLLLRPSLRQPTEFHGTRYGGWSILRDSLAPTSVVYSFGIGEDASFDLSLINKYSCRVHAFDPTPKSIAWVERNVGDERFVFHPWAAGANDGTLKLFLPKRTDFASASMTQGAHTSAASVEVPCFTVQTIMQRLGHDSLEVLKMDIESAEYGVLDQMGRDGTLQRVRQLLVEFHHWFPEVGLAPTRDAIRRLRAAGFQIAWVSPTGREVLFIASRPANPPSR